MQSRPFWKYHALGNSYIVLDGFDPPPTKEIQRICRRDVGIGSDGLLIGRPLSNNHYELRIFNPDGSEAEKSGNGLRIFAQNLWDQKLCESNNLSVSTKGGLVRIWRDADSPLIAVEMGKAWIPSDPQAPAAQPGHFEKLTVENQTLSITTVSMGNPHCVIFLSDASEVQCRKLGPLIEIHRDFPNRTNVQFVTLIDHDNIALQIWERGAGYTRSSGSSACAAAAAAHFHQYIGQHCTVHSPGGQMKVKLDDQLKAILYGDVQKIAEGRLYIIR
ncbi:MAG: diaminopimelate epimerase [Ardenticatenaceae bacterium]|nr:diaminopimelate epimerase [Ardenticatenaceae bacterium]